VVLGRVPGRDAPPGISAKQLQRQLGLSRYETAWLILQKLRRAMVAPERTLLTHEVEIDEFYLGGHEEGLKGGRKRGKKALVGVAIEVPGNSSGRLRLAVLPDASGPTLLAFTQATSAPGANRAHRRGVPLTKLSWGGNVVMAGLDPLPRDPRVACRPDGLSAGRGLRRSRGGRQVSG
jgi:ISXO2-like transposase domain